MNPKQRSALSKIFAVSGTLLLLAPILFMLVTAVVGSIAGKALLFDYLMLAELFPLVALGLRGEHAVPARRGLRDEHAVGGGVARAGDPGELDDGR